MIVVKLMGGLGNQMFQYAAGRALSLKHHVPLLCDEEFLNRNPKGAYTQRRPELHQVKIKAETASRNILKNFQQDNFWDKIFRRKDAEPDVLIEGQAVNSRFFTVGKQVYLNGFWQSEEYFANYRPALLHEFQPAYDLDETAKKYLHQIRNCNAVSIHVRRGDYVQHPGANQFHGLIGMQYYTKAIEHVRHLKESCHFFIFSDDLPWCKQNFNFLDKITFVESNSDFSFTDMYLMKHCRHHIIANSSYSWWGAWLCEEPGNITVAPGQWLMDKNLSTEKIYCKNWIRI